MSYQTCIKLSDQDVSLNHTGTLLKVFSKNHKRTSKKFARMRTAKKEKKRKKKKKKKKTTTTMEEEEKKKEKKK